MCCSTLTPPVPLTRMGLPACSSRHHHHHALLYMVYDTADMPLEHKNAIRGVAHPLSQAPKTPLTNTSACSAWPIKYDCLRRVTTHPVLPRGSCTQPQPQPHPHGNGYCHAQAQGHCSHTARSTPATAVQAAGLLCLLNMPCLYREQCPGCKEATLKQSPGPREGRQLTGTGSLSCMMWAKCPLGLSSLMLRSS